MFATLVPTPELFEVPVNGVKLPTRIWYGKTRGGIDIEAYVFAIVPVKDGDYDALGAELPDFMVRTRDVVTINFPKEP